MEEEPPTPPQPTSPFWLQSTTTSRHRLRSRLPSSSVFLSTGFLVSILSISAIVFLVLVIPSLLSFTNQVFKPNSVRKGWDSVNLVLVLFAVVCGFLGRKDYDDQRDLDLDLDDSFNVTASQSPLRSHQQYTNWYDYDFGDQGNVTKLRRTSSSYPDLRQEIAWDVEYDHRPRYYDDSYTINAIRPPRSIKTLRSRREFNVGDDDEGNSVIKRIDIDNVSTRIEKESVPSPPPPPPPIYYSRESKRGKKPPRVRKAKISTPSLPIPIARSPPPPPPPAPPPQPPLDHHQFDEISKKSSKIVTKDILTSIYSQSKRKNKLFKTKSHENLKDLRRLSPLPPPTTPPPPPPPPSKTLHKPKKITSNSISHPFTSKSTKFDPMDETSGDGYESPVIPIPPPPPPPPFKLLSWKFPVVHGDYVKITNSLNEGGFDESEFEDGDSDVVSIPVTVNQTPITTFCPSPDVNTKADDFIARFRASLKLEKINSIKIKEGMGIGFSPLGPDSSPNPSPHAMAVSGSF